MQKLNHQDIELIAEDLNSKLKDSFITNIFLLNSKDIVFSFSFYRDEKLLVSLNHHTPFVSLIKKELTSPTILNKTNEFLRKEIKNTAIKDISNFNNDRIILFSLEKRDEFYNKKIMKMYIELIPNRSNFVVTDEKDIVLFATTYTTIDSERRIIKGLPYEVLENSSNNELTSSLDLNFFKKEANEYIEESLTFRKKEKYKTLYTHIKSKISSLKKKIKELEREYQESDKAIVYKEYGDMIYAYLNDEKALEEYIKTIPNYNSQFSPSDNAQQFYKKYKKAQRGKEMILEQINLAKVSLEENELLFNSYPYLNEDELMDLNEKLFKVKRKGKPVPAYLPSYVLVGNTKIAFGKNNKQNDYLTFKLSKPHYHYFHVDKYHGSHVVIFSDNPTNEMKTIASEICLILSNLTVGDILTTEIKNVKKGDTTGKVNLLNYSLITLKNVRNETKELLFNATRFSS